MILYERIRQRRALLDMSQQTLADRTGYTDRSSVAKIEAGLVDLTQSKIAAFAKALDTTPAYLMGWTNKTDGAWDEELTADEMLEARGTTSTSQAGGELTLHEKRVITAYKEQPNMQPAVDKLLGVEPELKGGSLPAKNIEKRDKEQEIHYIAARGGGVRRATREEMDTLDVAISEAIELKKLKKSNNQDEEDF